MKRLKLLVAGACLIFMTCGCDDDYKLNSKGDTSGGVGFIPRINNVMMFNINDPNNPTGMKNNIFAVGDHANFEIIAEDKDLNMITLWETIYTNPNSGTPFEGPTPITLPKQSAEVVQYSMVNPEPFVLKDIGDFQIIFQIEDKSGNKTDVRIISFKVQ